MKRTHQSVRIRAVCFIAVCMVAGCGGDASAPNDPTGATPRGLEASAPVAALGVESPASATVVYLSAYPGTVPRAATARIMSPGAAERPVEALDGGFDPVAVEAKVGDVLTVVVTDSAGSSTTATTAVKSGRPPRVVRTSPSPRRTDVPLNAIIRVVFSTPMTLESVREGVRLTQAGTRVSAELRAGDASGVAYDLIPVEQLVPATAYAIEIAPVVEDVNGVPLGEAVNAPFTTASSPTPATAAHVVLSNEFYTLEPEWEVPVGYEVALYARALDANYLPINSEVTFSGEQPGLVQFSVPDHAGRDWWQVNVRGVGVGRATIVARADNAVTSASLVVYRQVDPATALVGARVVGALEEWTDGIVQGSEVFQAEANSQLLLIAHRTGRWHRSPMTSANGLIAFERAFMTGQLQDSVRVVIRYPDGWEQLTPTGGDQYCPSWSPDGTRLVFTEYYRDINGRRMTTLVVIDQAGQVQSSWPAPSGQSEPCAGWTLDGRSVGLFALPAPDPRPSGIPRVDPSLAALMIADSVRRSSTFVWSLDEGRWISNGSGPGVELHDGKRSRDGRWFLVVAGSNQLALLSRDRTLRAQLGINGGVPRSPSFAY